MRTLKLSRYVVDSPRGDVVTLWATRSGRIIDIPRDEWESIKAFGAKFEESPFVRILCEAGILVSDLDVEEQAILDENEYHSEQDPSIDLVIAPSSNCTLGCNLPHLGGYCGQEHQKGSMSHESIDELARLIKRSKQSHHKSLRVSWFGGEPLLAFDRMEYASKIFLQAAHELGLIYQADIVTGGTHLSVEIARKCLIELGINELNVTIDGPETVHDSRRSTKAGKGTFLKIVANLQSIISDPSLDSLALTIRCNVDKRNAPFVTELLEFLAALQWQGRVHVYFANVHPWGGRDNRDVELRGYEYANWEIQWVRRLKDLGFSKPSLPKRKPIVCRVVSSSRMVVSQLGTLHRCTETPLTPMNILKDNVGLISDWQTLERVPKWTWHQKVRDGAFPCSKCTFLPVCGGTCPLSWETGSDIPCPPYKYNAAQLLQLRQEYLEDVEGGEGEAGMSSSYAIPVMMRQIAATEEFESIDTLIQVLAVHRVNWKNFSSPQFIASLTQDPVVHFANYRLRKLEFAYRLSTVAYLQYKVSDLDAVVASTQGALNAIFYATQDSELDGRFAQIQMLLNLISAQLRLSTSIDTELAIQLRRYLDGGYPLRVGFTFLRQIESGLQNKEPVLSLRASLQNLTHLAGSSRCSLT